MTTLVFDPSTPHPPTRVLLTVLVWPVDSVLPIATSSQLSVVASMLCRCAMFQERAQWIGVKVLRIPGR
jgi:hypothetical protein